jgi:hypothetical protein
VLGFRGGVGTDQTVFSVADQVASARFTKRGDDDLSVFGAEILEKSSSMQLLLQIIAVTISTRTYLKHYWAIYS